MLQVLLTRGEEESNTAACRLQQAVTVCRLKSSLESRKEGSLGRRGGTLFLQVDLAGASSHTVGKWPIPGIVVQALQIAYVLKQLLILMTGSNLLVHFLEHRNLALHVFSFCQPPTSLPASCLGLFRLNLARSFLASTVQLLSKLLIASQTCQLSGYLAAFCFVKLCASLACSALHTSPTPCMFCKMRLQSDRPYIFNECSIGDALTLGRLASMPRLRDKKSRRHFRTLVYFCLMSNASDAPPHNCEMQPSASKKPAK